MVDLLRPKSPFGGSVWVPLVTVGNTHCALRARAVLQLISSNIGDVWFQNLPSPLKSMSKVGKPLASRGEKLILWGLFLISGLLQAYFLIQAYFWSGVMF